MIRSLLGVFLLCFSLSVSAQVIATTEDGKKVILKKDGTWMYLEDYTKSLTSEPAPTPAKEEAPPAKKKTTMADIKCGDIIGMRMNQQTREENQSLVEDLVISEPEDETRFSMVLAVNSSKTFAWDLALKGINGCAAQTPSITIRYVDGSRTKLSVQNDFVCDTYISLYLSKGLGNKNDIKALRSKPIKSIAVEMRDRVIEEDLSDEQSAILQKAFNCLQGK